MKILLVLSPTPLNIKNYSSSKDTEFPMGLCYLAAVLEKAGFSPEIFDFQLANNPIEAFADKLKENKYDVIGFSVVTPSFGATNRMAAIVKEVSPKTKVIIGGAHPSILGPNVLQEMPNVDIAALREGEATIVELIQFLEKGKPLDQVKGIAFRNDDKIISNGHRELIKNLDDIPFPARHLVNMKKYVPTPGQFFKLPILSMVASRGCAFRCAYCVDNLVWPKYRVRSAKNVVDEMEFLKNTYEAKEIKFLDGAFSTNRQRTIEICNEILKRNLGLIWRCETRVDLIDPELLTLMWRSGCLSISFGFESGDDEILKKMNKRTTTEQARKAVAWCKAVGIQAKGFFMLNYPGDTIETTERTIRFSRELDLDFVGFNMTTPYPGTKFYNEVEKNYKINEKCWGRTDIPVGNRIYFFQNGLSENYLKKAYRRAVLGFFLRPKTLLKILIRSFLFQIKNPRALQRSFSGLVRILQIKIQEDEKDKGLI